jgi:hypothetical protein
MQADSYGANSALWLDDYVESVEADPSALDSPGHGQLGFIGLSLFPSNDNQATSKGGNRGRESDSMHWLSTGRGFGFFFGGIYRFSQS